MICMDKLTHEQLRNINKSGIFSSNRLTLFPWADARFGSGFELFTVSTHLNYINITSAALPDTSQTVK
jgi:hypothetical protein